jgi:hypothetical protein
MTKNDQWWKYSKWVGVGMLDRRTRWGKRQMDDLYRLAGKRIIKAMRVVEKYHLHVNSPDYGDIRKRGNPSTVLDAVAYIRWGNPRNKRCECCKVQGEIQLHHKNGNWKDYRLENLIWLCKGCHLQYHSNQRRITMSTKKSNKSERSYHRWDTENLNKLNVEVNKHPTKAQGYEYVSNHSKKIFGNQLSVYAIKNAHVKYVVNGKVSPKNTRKDSAKNNRTLLLSDAVKIYKFFTDHGYTIING